jgi:hypothetical protein
MTKTSESLPNVKGKISILTEYIQKMTFKLRRLQKLKDKLEAEK